MADVATHVSTSPHILESDHSVKVKFGKKPVLELKAGPLYTVSELKERVESEFGVGKARQKLVTKGKALKDDAAIVCDVVKRGGVIMLISSTDIEVEKLQSNADAAQHEMQVKEERRKNKNYISIAKRMAEGSGGGIQSMSETYGFMSFETLKGFNDEARAAKFLKGLSEDVGIKHVMKKYKWQVGKLTEMYPKGKVGISEVCIMGLNVNQGQEIKLRLRTDNLEGFRNHLSVMKVLYHELAHNVHGPHDGKFFKLMREIEKDACEYRDKYNSAEKLGGTHEIQDASWDDGDNQRTSGKLGGDTVLQNIFSAREMAASAAVFRLSAEEESIMENCGCNQNHPLSEDATLTKRQRAAQRVDLPMELDEDDDDELTAALKLSMMSSTEAGAAEEESRTDDSKMEATASTASTVVKENILMGRPVEDTKETTSIKVTARKKMDEDFITQDIIEMVLLSNRDESLGEVTSKQKEAEGAVAELFRCRNKEKVVAALDTLIMMVQNMVENPREEKFKKVRLNNKKFHGTVGSIPGGIKFLLAIGFKDTGNETLGLSRNDPGLLWLGHSILVQVREMAS